MNGVRFMILFGVRLSFGVSGIYVRCGWCGVLISLCVNCYVGGVI